MATGVETGSIDVASLLADVIEITKDLFPGEVLIDVVTDPEYPQTRLTVIEAQASGPVKDDVDRRVEWHKRVSQLGESCSNLCLAFNYHE